MNVVKKQIVIDAEFRGLLVPLSQYALAELEYSLKQEGCRDPLIVWDCDDANKVILLDGHNRLDICRHLRIRHENPIVKTLDEIPNREAAKEWILRNQLGRRNLTPGEFNLYLGKLYNEQKQEHGGDRKSSAQNEHLTGDTEATAEKLAREHGVSQATVRRAGELAESVETLKADDPSIEQKLIGGKVTRQQVIAKAKAKPQSLADVPKDEDGVTIPEHLRDIFAAADDFEKTAGKVSTAKGALTAAVERSPAAWSNSDVQKWEERLRDIRFEIEESRPYLLCLECTGGAPGSCPHCGGKGWLSRGSARNVSIEDRNTHRRDAGLDPLIKASQRAGEITAPAGGDE
jgi:hypothetical protein